MIKNYLKSAFRNLLRNKLYTALNVAGLTFGITCFLLIGLYLFDELTFDRQHNNASRIYRVIEHKNVSGEETTIAAVGYKLAEESKNTITEIENVTRMQRIGRGNVINPNNPENFQESITVTDNRFLSIFDFELLHGDKITALKEPNTIVVTEDLARRLFKTTDIVGKVIKIDFMDKPIKVTGVLKNHLRNSSFDFSLLLSGASFQSDEDQLTNDWLSNNFSVYVLLKPDANSEVVADKMKKLVRSNFTPPAGTEFSFRLQSLTAMHLNSENIVDGARNINVDAMPQGSSLYIKVFSFVALFVLALAGINYMNLTTARASNRLKEIGIRKTMGATVGNLVKQLMIESLIVTFVSFLFAVVIVELTLPAFNQFTSKQLVLGGDYRIWLLSIAFVTATGFLSGSYPSWLLSRSQPVSLLKGLKIEGKNDLSIRKGLIIFQFAISTIMIIGTIVIFLQVKYLKNANLGFNKDLLVVIDVNKVKARSNFETVKSEMAKLPSVKSVSVTSRVPGEWKMFRTVKIKNDASLEEPKVAYSFGADKDFIKTFEVKLLIFLLQRFF
ncbi:MAG: FtsX-like permease family protein [Pedobacter sp.]|nr:MAG: FtsX-like permease family protein [Pedobacter sp.]